MWYLTDIKTNTRFYLLHSKAKYAVRRSAVDPDDLVLATDASISRSHAALHPAVDHVKLVDTGSKYGTFVNGNIDTNVPMAKIVPVELHQLDKIRFGRLESVYRLDRLHINSLSTTLTADEKKDLKRDLTTLNGNLLADWTDQCTHLTVVALSITMKVLHALAGTVPIVTPAYWTAYIEAARAGALEPPDANAFRPPIAEAYIAPDVSLRPNVERRRLFAHKEFVFMLHRHMERYELCIRLAGGRCTSLERKKLHRSTLLKPHVCVVQYHPSTQSQTSADIGEVSRFLRERNLRTIPESEIGLALLHCSTRKYCNAAFRVDGEFAELDGLVRRTPSAVLAEETEPVTSAAALAAAAACLEVPETVTVIDDEVVDLPEIDSQQMYAALNLNESVPPAQSMVYDTVPAVLCSKRRASSPDDVGMGAAKRSKASENPVECEPPLNESKHELLGDDDDDDDDLLSSISQQVEATHAVAMRSESRTERPDAYASQSQSFVNASGFLPRLRPTAAAVVVRQPHEDDQAVDSISQRPADVLAATRKRAHNLLHDSDSDDDDDNGGGGGGGSANLFQFKAAPALPKRSRHSVTATRRTADDSQQANSFAATPLDSQQSEEPLKAHSVNNSDALYPSRQHNASRLLSMTVQPLNITLLTGWLSKSSIKCEPKLENGERAADDVDGVDRKPLLTLDGRIDDELADERADSKAWMDQLRCGFDVRVRRMQLVNRTVEEKRAGDVTVTGVRNFKAFAKKNNFRAQTSILKTVPAIPTALNMFDF